MAELEGKVALITGASRGIGRAIAKRFVEEGAHVAFSYRSSKEKAEALEKELAGKGGSCKGYPSDASSLDEAEDLVKKVLDDHGRIDAVVNNAGITRDNLLLRISEEDWDQVIDTNLKSVFNLTKAAQKPLLKQRSGSIINMSSVVGVQGNAGQTNYAASKAGILGFTRSVALELGARGVRCNAIAPGFIETEMTEELDEETLKNWREAIPLKRGGKPEDVAELAVFLASDRSAYVTAQTIHVCGGMLPS